MWSPTARQAGKCSPICLWSTREMFLQTDCCLCLALWCWLLTILPFFFFFASWEKINYCPYSSQIYLLISVILCFRKSTAWAGGQNCAFSSLLGHSAVLCWVSLGYAVSISVLNLLINRIGEIVPAHGWCWLRMTQHNPWKFLVTRSAGQKEAVVSKQTLPTWRGRQN